jgi:hypothetical protein
MPKKLKTSDDHPAAFFFRAREFFSAADARRGQPERTKPQLWDPGDRDLIATMVYSFAPINAVLEMKVRDYFVQGRRGWVRLHEKDGKEHEVPCHHNLEEYLDEYIAARQPRQRPGRTPIPHGGPQDRHTYQKRPCGSRTPTA